VLCWNFLQTLGVVAVGLAATINQKLALFFFAANAAILGSHG